MAAVYFIQELCAFRAFLLDGNFSSSKYQIKFIFLGASISNLVYLLSFSFSSNLISFSLYIILKKLFIHSK